MKIWHLYVLNVQLLFHLQEKKTLQIYCSQDFMFINVLIMKSVFV